MSKTSPDKPLIAVRPPRKAGLLRKAARVGATVVAARVAADTGKKGVIGLIAGMGAKRLIMRHPVGALFVTGRSEEHTSELQSLMRISYAVFCLKKKTYANFWLNKNSTFKTKHVNE